MKKNSRNAKWERIHAERAAHQIRNVGLNSYIELFNEGYEIIVLFDAHTGIHPSMHDKILPGMNDAKRQFVNAYTEVLLKARKEKIIFAFVDYNAEDKSQIEQNENILSFIHGKVTNQKYDDIDNPRKIGEIRFISSQRGIIGSLDIRDVSDGVETLWKMALPSYSRTEFEKKIRYIQGPDKGHILSMIVSLGIQISQKRDSFRITPPNL